LEVGYGNAKSIACHAPRSGGAVSDAILA